MTMSWHDLLFMHWPIDVARLRPLLPASLPLDTFDGTAWVGVVPFRMSHVVPRGVPPLPWISAFAELNVRTYVDVGGKPGVFFFSLDAANPLAVWIARTAFRLSYFRARMQVDRSATGFRYHSRRVHRGAPPASFLATYAPDGPPYRATTGSLEHWLTERYCLYTTAPDGDPRRVEIHHRPWPLQPAQAHVEENGMAACHGIDLPSLPPLLHFAERLDVVAWPPERIRGARGT